MGGAVQHVLVHGSHDACVAVLPRVPASSNSPLLHDLAWNDELLNYELAWSGELLNHELAWSSHISSARQPAALPMLVIA